MIMPPGFGADELEPPDTHAAERRLRRSSAIIDALQVAVVVVPVMALVLGLVIGLPAYLAQASRADRLARVVTFQASTEARFLRYLQRRDEASTPAERDAALEAFTAEQGAAEAEALRQGVPVPTVVSRARGRSTTTTSSRLDPAPPSTGPPSSSPSSTTPCTVTAPTLGCVAP